MKNNLIKAAIICSRKFKRPKGLTNLLQYFENINVPVILQEDKSSIFSAYGEAIQKYSNPDDIFVFCHDDIEILNDGEDFLEILNERLTGPETGFVGVAGTRYLGKDAVWWNHDNWGKGYHRGFIFHGTDKWNCYPTGYTSPKHAGDNQVVVLDGVFLAATLKTLKTVGMWEKPEFFSGNWDFYDIYTTHKAHKLGLKNYVVPIILVHNSAGELVGRDSWLKNQKAFIQNTDLPEILL